MKRSAVKWERVHSADMSMKIKLVCKCHSPTVSCPVSWPRLFRAFTVTLRSDCKTRGLSWKTHRIKNLLMPSCVMNRCIFSMLKCWYELYGRIWCLSLLDSIQRKTILINIHFHFTLAWAVGGAICFTNQWQLRGNVQITCLLLSYTSLTFQ